MFIIIISIYKNVAYLMEAYIMVTTEITLDNKKQCKDLFKKLHKELTRRMETAVSIPHWGQHWFVSYISEINKELKSFYLTIASEHNYMEININRHQEFLVVELGLFDNVSETQYNDSYTSVVLHNMISTVLADYLNFKFCEEVK